LRGATAFATLLLCVLGVMMIARTSRPSISVAQRDEKKYTQQELDAAVNKAAERTRGELAVKQNESTTVGGSKDEPRQLPKRMQIAANQTENARPRSLNRQEREQLAADLRLTSAADEEELLLALPDQEKPNQ